ncbi:hypothetical protein V8D89_010051 [Ganoderma adspersum]
MFPTQAENGLLDCDRFLKSNGELTVLEFDEEFMRATVNVNSETFKNMESWVRSSCYHWVAVSYDSSTSTTSQDHANNVTFEVFQDTFKFHIRYDVLKLLCEAARDRFQANYLWLDRLCIQGDEMAMWRLPGNIRRAFGFAKGTLVLPNGLSQMLPLFLPEGKYHAIFHTSDLVRSLRVLLELSFTASLENVVVPLTSYPQAHLSLNTGCPSAEAAYYWQVTTIPLAKFLCPDKMGGYISQPVPNYPTNVLDPVLHLALIQLNDSEQLRLQGLSLLALLSYREWKEADPSNTQNETSYQGPNLGSNRTVVMANWEEAIWRNVLFHRTADTPIQLVLGLAWLLQDFCNVYRCMEPSHLDLVSVVTNDVGVGQIPESGYATTGILANQNYATIPFGLSIVVSRFQKISAPSSKLVERLIREGPWKIPFSPEWKGTVSDSSNIVTVSQLELAVMSHYQWERGVPVLGLRLTPLAVKDFPPIVGALPSRDPRASHADWEYWYITRYRWQLEEEEESWVEPAPEQCTRKFYQITPHCAFKEFAIGQLPTQNDPRLRMIPRNAVIRCIEAIY